ncbi:MAG: hypothetical protein HY528_02500 [Chloroflexi bacterium]|nr:hypothetical protein [Chloroflexota bacterium]
MSPEIPRSWESLGEEQLKIYAKEIAELYRQEQQLRQVLEEKNRELEQRVRELTGLNNLFQQHLSEQSPMIEITREIVVELGKFARDANRLAERAKRQLFLNNQVTHEGNTDKDKPSSPSG